MPRLSEAKKDVISCDKPWGGANILRSADLRMGQPVRPIPDTLPKAVGVPGELKHLSSRRKRK